MQKETKLLNLDKNNIIQVLDNVIQNKNDADEIIMQRSKFIEVNINTKLTVFIDLCSEIKRNL